MIWNFLKKKTAAAPLPEPQSPTHSRLNLPIGYLQNLMPIGELPPDELQQLVASVRSFLPGQIIFNRGESADEIIYLYSGKVYLEANNGAGYNIEEATFKACYPLSTGSEHQFSAIAKSATQIIYLPLSALRRSSQVASAYNPLDNLQNTSDTLRKSNLFHGFCNAIRRDELHVPTLPDVALRLRSAMQQDISIADVVKIVNLDPVIASKLIQVANSPLYRTVKPIAKLHDAINRLGLKATQNLVTSISLHNLFRSKSRLLNNRIQQLWRQSIQVASLSYTLAGLTSTVNPDEALLAGLVHNIGALPIITYAESLPENAYTELELDETFSVLQAMVGVIILKKWNFPENLLQIPAQTDNWYCDDQPNLQLSDIVLLARFHAQLGGTQKQKLPPLNTLPAYIKLGDKSLTPDMSLQALQDAKQQIAEALSFFRA